MTERGLFCPDRHDASVQDHADRDGTEDSSAGDRARQDAQSSRLVASFVHAALTWNILRHIYHFDTVLLFFESTDKSDAQVVD